jgi:hypothetical protein
MAAKVKHLHLCDTSTAQLGSTTWGGITNSQLPIPFVKKWDGSYFTLSPLPLIYLFFISLIFLFSPPFFQAWNGESCLVVVVVVGWGERENKPCGRPKKTSSEDFVLLACFGSPP